MAHDLAAAGLRRINVSLDSLRPEVFHALTRRDDLDRVLAGIDAALDAGLDPVKINCVVIRGVNDDEVVDLARVRARRRASACASSSSCRSTRDGEWTHDQVVPAAEILERDRRGVPARSTCGCPDRGTSSRRSASRYADGVGDVGVIASVTEPFCDNCDRIRITAEGKLRTCLFALDEFDLRVDPARRRGPSERRRPARRRDRAGRRHEVGGPPHRPGRLHPPAPLDEPDRRLTPIGLLRTWSRNRAGMPYTSPPCRPEFTHLDPLGRARMVDVTSKDATHRRAVARCRVVHGDRHRGEDRLRRGHKGDVLAVARVAGIQAAKQTPNLLPLCHPLLVGSVYLNFRIEDDHVEVEAQVDTVDRTGVEMEALTACAIAALTIYDMCKSIDRAMTIGELALWEKTGGRSGTYRRAPGAGVRPRPLRASCRWQCRGFLRRCLRAMSRDPPGIPRRPLVAVPTERADLGGGRRLTVLFILILVVALGCVARPTILRAREPPGPDRFGRRLPHRLTQLGRTNGRHGDRRDRPSGLSLQRPLFAPPGRRGTHDARVSSVAATCCSCSWESSAVTLLAALVMRSTPVLLLNLLADAALVAYVYLLVPAAQQSREQRAKVRFLGSAYRARARSARRHRPLGRASRTGRRLVPLRQTASRWRVDHAGRSTRAVTQRATSRGEAPGARAHARGVAQAIRRAAPRSAPCIAASSRGGPRAHRRSRRLSRGGRRGARGPSRRALRGLHPRRQEGVRRGQPHARLRADDPMPTAAELGVEVQAYLTDGRGGERAAPPDARLPAPGRARRAERLLAVMDDGLRVADHDRLSRRADRRPPAEHRRVRAVLERTRGDVTPRSCWPGCRTRSSSAARADRGGGEARGWYVDRLHGGVAQPGRALRSQRRSRGFKSHHLHANGLVRRHDRLRLGARGVASPRKSASA